jgi:hypothetical protein
MRGVMLVILVTCLAVAGGCITRDRASNAEKERAIVAAQRVFAEEQAKGTDFSNGPCIAEEVIDDWSVDIAHDPRDEIDDRPENQCQFYRDGQTNHFVELAPDGKVLRVK